MAIRNCHGNDSAVMLLSNAKVELSNSVFTNNGVLISHSQISADNCSLAFVNINSCVFSNDLASRPVYKPGLMLAGCKLVRLHAADSRFQTAPILVKADLDSDVRLDGVLLSGVAVRGSSLDITLGPGNNTVVLKHCNVTGHLASHSSAVSIATDSSPHSSTVTLQNVRFHDNQRQKTRGAAMSIFARFSRQSAPLLNVSLMDCAFINNSVDDWQVAGALYVANVAVVRLFRNRFLWNAATDGGAVYVYSSSGVLISDSEFDDNSAVSLRQTSYASRGGALYAEFSELQVIDSSFANNTAQYSGSAMFVSDTTALSLIRCVFSERPTPTKLLAPDCAILSLSASRLTQTSSAVIKLTGCHVHSALDSEHVLVSVCGPASIADSLVSCQSDSLSLHHASLPAAQVSASYPLLQLSVWSRKSCPSGLYTPLTDSQCHLSLQGKMADLNDTVELCYACPEHAHCDSALVHPDYNYYVLSTGNGAADVMMCPAGYCQPTTSNSGQMCTEGRSGALCSDCDKDHVASFHFDGHISCQPRGDTSCIDYSTAPVVVVCSTLFYVVVLSLVLRLSTRQHSSGHVTTSSSLIGCVFPLVYFYQLLPSVYPRLVTSSWWLDRVIQFFVSLFHLHPAVFTGGRGFCLSPFSDDPSSVVTHRYFFTMSVYWSQLVLIGILFSTLSAVFLFYRGPFTDQNIKMLASYFLPAFVLFQMFSNVPLLRCGLQSVHCVTYNDSSVLFDDAAMSCYAPWQIFAVLYVVVCVAPLCLVFDTAAYLLSRGRVSVLAYLCLCLVPLLGLLAVPLKNLRQTARRRDESRDEFDVDETTPPGLRTVSTHSVVLVQTVVIKPFHSYWPSSAVDVGWMTIILLRNFIICTFSTLLQHVPPVRSVLVSVLCLAFTVDHILARGYVLRTANRLDAACWLMLTTLSTLDIYVSVVYTDGRPLSTWSAVDWLARLLTSLPVIVIVCLVVVLISRAVIRRGACCRHTRPVGTPDSLSTYGAM